MMNMYKPKKESAYEKAGRIKIKYDYLKDTNEQVYYFWNKERSWSLQIIDILYREVWQHLPPGTQTMLFYQTQSYLKNHYDNIIVPDGLCLDVYGRLSKITKDWRPESNDVIPDLYVKPI